MLKRDIKIICLLCFQIGDFLNMERSVERGIFQLFQSETFPYVHFCQLSEIILKVKARCEAWKLIPFLGKFQHSGE